MDKMQTTQEVNVRVAVRVRPLLPKEKINGESSCVKVKPSSNQLVLGKDRSFTFDHVLTSRITQDQVYETCVDPLVKSCFEGYNATVFAYGQTGSGKTFTVGGDNITAQAEEDFGIIPRAIQHMFNHIKNTQERDFTFKVSYIEIYKEELRDLLDVDTSKDIHIREDEHGNTVIAGPCELECQTADDVIGYLEQGATYRHTGSTQMNEHSSRSHSIFTVLIEQRWADGGNGEGERGRPRHTSETSEIILDDTGDIEHYMGAKFHFVDLAGSERAHRTGNVGDRFKESVHINSGLLALGNVISALGDVKKKVLHIPYRDSKITRLLKDSLGGNAKTVMICCISPSSSNFDESLNALKYANRARNITNKPVVNRDPQSIKFEEMQSEIKALRAELQRQRTSTRPGTQDVGGDGNDSAVVTDLQDQVCRLQTECGHHRMIVEEANKLLAEILQREVLSRSQTSRLTDWMDLLDEIKNKVPSTLKKDQWDNQRIDTLEQELKQCRNDLKSDEEIFAEKVKEVSSLQDHIAELEEANLNYQTQNEMLQEESRKLQELMVNKQMELDEAQERLKDSSHQLVLDSSMENVSGPPTTSRRAQSVPAQLLGRRSMYREEVARDIHTSPALFSVERVLQSFRARSQLLVSRLEDSDDVRQPAFSDDDADSGRQDSLSDDSDTAEIVFGNTHEKSAFDRSSNARGTYKVKRPRVYQASQAGQPIRKSLTDEEKLIVATAANETLSKSQSTKFTNKDTDIQKKKLKRTEMEVRHSTQKMRELGINIRLKEQLIKELVKTGKESHIMNKQYEEKILALEHEREAAQAELLAMQTALNELETRGQQGKTDRDRQQAEFRKKMELAKSRIHTLQKKQRETVKMATITGQTDRRIQDSALAIEKMTQQQEQLQRRLRDEMEQKNRIEKEMQKEQQRVKELEIRNEQQKKVLKVKTEEMSAMNKKLRSSSHISHANSQDQLRFAEQKRTLDQEIERVLEQRKHVEDLQKELSKREEAISKKETLLSEKSQLEIKKLRSSQMLSNDIQLVAGKISAVEQQIVARSADLRGVGLGQSEVGTGDQMDMAKLQQERDRLCGQRDVLTAKLTAAQILTTPEERRLLELDETMEAIDAAIEYRNELILGKRLILRESTSSEQYSETQIMPKLKTFSPTEIKLLLAKYFEKVIDLRDEERRKAAECGELEVRCEDLERLVAELERSLQRASMDADRKLTVQQQQHEQKIQLLVQQLTAAGQNEHPTASQDMRKDLKVKELEKDLYYYKTISRDLKKKLREMIAEKLGTDHTALDTDRSGGDAGEGLSTPRESQDRTSRSHKSEVHSSATTPHSVRIPTKQLRRMSQEEIQLRKSAAEGLDIIKDSLEGISKKH